MADSEPESKPVDSPAPKVEIDGDVINLEALVRDLGDTVAGSADLSQALAQAKDESATEAQAPSPSEESIGIQTEEVSADVSGEVAAAAAPAYVEDPELASKVDDILAVEAPDLMVQITEMRTSDALSGTKAEIEVETIQPAQRPKGLRALVRDRLNTADLKVRRFYSGWKEIMGRLARDGKGFLKEFALELIGRILAWFKASRVRFVERVRKIQAWPASVKASLFLAVILTLSAGYIARLTLSNQLLPPPKREWVASFSEVADRVFTYSDSDGFEDFNDPLHHPEFIVVFDRIIVNLTPSPNASAEARPMAAMELYIQTDNQDAAVELKDRKVEMVDAVSRAVERMDYPTLSGEEGKGKLKLLIRKDLNEKLIRGRVRKVYIKTIVLNPEET